MKRFNHSLYICLALVGMLSCSTDDTSLIDPIDQIIGGGDPVLGSGTDADPYQLRTAEHLDVFMRNSLTSSFVLLNDIDLTTYIEENYATDGWLPINGFAGVLDGADFTISGLWIERPTSDNIGFFGELGNDTNSIAVTIEIKNLTLEIAASKSVTGRTRTAALVGSANDGLGVTNVHIRGGDANSQVHSTETQDNGDFGRSGTLIGLADRTEVIRCSSTVKMVADGGHRIGGLIGMINTTIVDQCYATGDVEGGIARIGGLIGFAFNAGSRSQITNSFATGNVSVVGSGLDDIGGFVGATDASISPVNCYTKGNIIIDGTVSTYGYFSGDGDGGSGIFGSTAQTILDGSSADISSGAVSNSIEEPNESGFILINLGSSTCADFSSFESSIWSCTNGSFPVLITNS